MCPTSGRFKFESITRLVAWEHDRLDGLLVEATRQVEAGQLQHAKSLFRPFDEGLRRHIRLEEEVLFPAFEARTGVGPGGSLLPMRTEHRSIEAQLTRMRTALEVGDAAEYGEGLNHLHSMLGPHHLREEHVLCPTMDDLLSPTERLSVVDQLAGS